MLPTIRSITVITVDMIAMTVTSGKKKVMTVNMDFIMTVNMSVTSPTDGNKISG
jgi:hypothetical protein